MVVCLCGLWGLGQSLLVLPGSAEEWPPDSGWAKVYVVSEDGEEENMI